MRSYEVDIDRSSDTVDRFKHAIRQGRTLRPVAVIICGIQLFLGISFACVAQTPGSAASDFADSLATIERTLQESDRCSRNHRNWLSSRLKLSFRPLTAFLLGKCRSLSEEYDEALALFRQVIDSAATDPLRNRASLAFIADAFESGAVEAFLAANEAFFDLLDRGVTDRAFIRHLERLRLIVPEDLALALTDWPDASVHEALSSWLRSQDPLPGSPINERLIEHLMRCRHALAEFPNPGAPHGLDARGEVYVRFGKPTERKEITLNAIAGELLRPGVTVNLSDIPDSEFWVYRSVDRTANYLFTKDSDHFEHAGITDLVPEALRFGHARSGRGLQKSRMLISVLQEIYRQLAPIHQDFAAMYAEIDNYAEDRGVASIREQVNRPIFEYDPGGALQGRMRPNDFAVRALVAGESEDDQRRAYRDRVVPRQFSTVMDETDRLRIAVRTARFLDEGLTTRTELYWAPYSDALRLSKRKTEALSQSGHQRFDRFLVDYFVSRFSPDYALEDVVQDRLILTDISIEDDSTIPVQTAVSRGASGLYHIGIQWDQFLLIGGNDSTSAPVKGLPVKIGTFRQDSLLALSTDPGVLEMSDPVPHVVTDAAQAVATRGASGSSPYPFQEVTPGTPLALVFEIYNLNFGRNDETQYRVTYEIRRRSRAGLPARERSETSSVSTRYIGSSRRSREYILVDLNSRPYAGEMEIDLTITDLVSDQKVSRALPFILLPGE